jgi:3-oxoacyl-[acyl-carrier protein] reductase
LYANINQEPFMDGKTVLITGAGIGLGKAMALTFAKEGYNVAVTDVLEEEGKAVAREINEAGGQASFIFMDVTSTDQVNAAVKEAEDLLGPIDTLICNAGIAKKIPLSTMKDEEWDLTMEVNLKGMMRVIRATSPSMISRGSGAILCLSSVVGTSYGWPDHIPYTASKGGVAGIVMGAAMELAGAGIRVNGIAPGLIRTAQTLDPVHSVGPEGLSAFAPNIPLGRIGDPSDIADVAVFLCSDKARYVTGQVLTVDGGLVIKL